MFNCGVAGHAEASGERDFDPTPLCSLPGKVARRCWCRKCKQSQMEIQLLKRLVHCGVHQNLHISYLFVGLGAGLKAATKCLRQR